MATKPVDVPKLLAQLKAELEKLSKENKGLKAENSTLKAARVVEKSRETFLNEHPSAAPPAPNAAKDTVNNSGAEDDKSSRSAKLPLVRYAITFLLGVLFCYLTILAWGLYDGKQNTKVEVKGKELSKEQNLPPVPRISISSDSSDFKIYSPDAGARFWLPPRIKTAPPQAPAVLEKKTLLKVKTEGKAVEKNQPPAPRPVVVPRTAKPPKRVEVSPDKPKVISWKKGRLKPRPASEIPVVSLILVPPVTCPSFELKLSGKWWTDTGVE